MMLSKITKESNQTAVLSQELDRLLKLPKMCQSNPDFWLGYISSYTAKFCTFKNRPFNDDDWKQLYEVIQVMITLASEKAIRYQNVCEVIVYSIYTQLKDKSQQNKHGLSIIKIRQSVQMLLTNLIDDNNHLKIKFVHSHEKNLVLQQQKLEIPIKDMIPVKNDAKQEKAIKKEEIAGGIGIECPICLSEVTLQTVCPVSCGHNLHRVCLIEHFKERVANKKLPIPCPEAGCNVEIIIADLQQYIPKQLLEKYYEFSLHEFVDKNSKNTNWCPTPGCQAVFTYENNLTTYNCPTCKKGYCLSCKTESHKGQTCEQNKLSKDLPVDEKQFLAFAEGAKIKQCPSCKFWVQKNKGCDHMTCRCGYEFCFRCGAKYGEGACQCDERDSFYGDDDDDDDGQNEQEYNGSEGIDFDDEIEHESQSRNVFVPQREDNRIQRIFIERPYPINRARAHEVSRSQMVQQERQKQLNLLQLIKKSFQK